MLSVLIISPLMLRSVFGDFVQILLALHVHTLPISLWRSLLLHVNQLQLARSAS